MLGKGLFSALMNWDDVDTEVMTTTTLYYLATEYLFNVLPKQQSKLRTYKSLSEVQEPSASENGLYVLTNAGRKQLFLLFRDDNQKTILLFDTLRCTAQICVADTSAYQYEIVHSIDAKWEPLNANSPNLVWNLKAASVLLVVQLLSIDAENVVAKRPVQKDAVTFLNFVKDVLEKIPKQIDTVDAISQTYNTDTLKTLVVNETRLVQAPSAKTTTCLVQSVLDVFYDRGWTFGLKLHAINTTTKKYKIGYHCP
jgi:hypothetical protein